ncbi:MAG TPA: ABC transporter substrate-binding protein [Casimicrobiaceae bacterium]|nr:ABC transporter substrate-binding protein [Casimicrobiaceae bacterium]
MRSAIVSWLAGALCALFLASPLAAQPGGKLVLYTSQPDRDAQRTVEGFRKKNPGVDVEIFRSGTTEVMSKLMAEIAAGAARADVLLIADALSMEKLKAAGELMPYPQADVRELPPAAYDGGKTYFGTKIITTGIIVNSQASMKPTSWYDLLKPEAKGQVALPSPLYSGAAAIHMAALQADPALGKDFYDKLAKNGAVALRGNGAVLNAVAGGQKMYGIIVEFMALNAKAKGSPVHFVFPKEGVSIVTEPTAILRSTKNPDAARAFVDFVLSKEGQELAVSQGYFPARKDVKPPAGFPDVASLRILPVDIAALEKQDEQNKKRFAELFGG